MCEEISMDRDHTERFVTPLCQELGKYVIRLESMQKSDLCLSGDSEKAYNNTLGIK